MIEQVVIDATLDDVELVRQRLIVKYGAAFTGLAITDQVRVIELVFKLIRGA